MGHKADYYDPNTGQAIKDAWVEHGVTLENGRAIVHYRVYTSKEFYEANKLTAQPIASGNIQVEDTEEIVQEFDTGDEARVERIPAQRPYSEHFADVHEQGHKAAAAFLRKHAPWRQEASNG